MTRLSHNEPRTIAYVNRRLAEGKTKPSIIRSHKSYVAHETFRVFPR